MSRHHFMASKLSVDVTTSASSLCQFQPVVLGVAPSLYGSAGFTCWFPLSRHWSLVATSAQRISTFNSAYMMSRHQLISFKAPLVFFRWRDFSLLSRQHLEFQHLHQSKPLIASRCFCCRDLHPLSRHQPLS